jgi:hypothetical protein
MTTRGASCGAAAVIQLSYWPGGRLPSWAVPVLAPTGTGIPASDPAVPLVTAARMPSRIGASRSAKGTGAGAGAGSAVNGFPVVPVARPSRGVTVCPVDTPVVNCATCSGVSCSSPCPMPRITVDPPYQAPPFASTESGVPR